MRLLFIIALLIIPIASQASHNRAGEITFRWLQGTEYEITIVTYTKTSSTQADRPWLDSVHFGDGSSARFDRINGPIDPISGYHTGEPLPGDIKYNIYRKNHLYPGNGTYKIYFVDPNRNDGVINVPNSFYTPFSVYTILNISTLLTPPDNSPILLNPPIDSGCVGVPYIYNPAAFDPDPGDRLTYELTVCRGENNDPIPGYTYPQASNSITIDYYTGELNWTSPVAQPQAPPWEYNIAFVVKEWRLFGTEWKVIGEVERDMQVRILNCPPNLHPPTIQNINDTCILAGDSLAFDVTAIDQDGDFVCLSASGGPFVIQDPAVFIQPSDSCANDTLTGTFSWNTSCQHIRQQPYQVTFRAQDIDPTISLVTYRSVSIRVIAPPVTGLTVLPNANTMELHWNPHPCAQVVKYNIYHRNGNYPGTIPCPCETGVPSYTGYTLIGSAPGGVNDTDFVDDNNGLGLPIGISHCYIVTAVFADGSESCASEEICNSLKKDLPVITHVTVGVTNAVTGVDTVIWSKATEIDTVAFPPPYQYKIYRSNDFFGNAFGPALATLPTEDDTIFVDAGINTFGTEHSYKIELYYDSDNNGSSDALKGSTQVASSIYLTLNPTDERMVLTWEEHVPWVNYRYDIFRRNALGVYVLIDSTTNSTYTDDSLTNDSVYCYYVRSVGTYATDSIIDPIINLSQRVCAAPVDNVPPCPPQLTVTSFCVDEQNFLQWTNPNSTCADDVMVYYIYYAADSSSGYEVIDSVSVPTDTTYFHENLSSLAGCYKVTAIDSSRNESTATAFCVDTCRQYVLPSVFTPNQDGQNDLYHPCDSTTSPDLQHKNCPPYKNVKDIDIKIYNRWGTVVFETTDKDINWDGKNKDSGGDCPDGVYYYTCIVNFYRLYGTESRELHGYIHLIRGK